MAGTHLRSAYWLFSCMILVQSTATKEKWCGGPEHRKLSRTLEFIHDGMWINGTSGLDYVTYSSSSRTWERSQRFRDWQAPEVGAAVLLIGDSLDGNAVKAACNYRQVSFFERSDHPNCTALFTPDYHSHLCASENGSVAFANVFTVGLDSSQRRLGMHTSCEKGLPAGYVASIEYAAAALRSKVQIKLVILKSLYWDLKNLNCTAFAGNSSAVFQLLQQQADDMDTAIHALRILFPAALLGLRSDPSPSPSNRFGMSCGGSDGSITPHTSTVRTSMWFFFARLSIPRILPF